MVRELLNGQTGQRDYTAWHRPPKFAPTYSRLNQTSTLLSRSDLSIQWHLQARRRKPVRLPLQKTLQSKPRPQLSLLETPESRQRPSKAITRKAQTPLKASRTYSLLNLVLLGVVARIELQSRSNLVSVTRVHLCAAAHFKLWLPSQIC